MAKFKVVEKKAIIMGVMEKTYHIEAESKEDAMQLVENNDADEFCIDIDYDIEQTEFLEIKAEQLK